MSLADRIDLCKQHGRTTEVVVVKCMDCERERKVSCSHALTNVEIATRHYRGWRIIGVKRSRRTRCPRCSSRGALKARGST